MNEKKRIIFEIVLIILSIAIVFLFSWMVQDKPMHLALKGSYSWGKVMIYPSEHENFRDYLGTATHEYAHYWMNKKSSKEFLKSWLQAVNKCGLESEYNFTLVKGKSAKMEEEFGECVKDYYLGLPTCCQDKYDLISGYGVLG